MSKRIVSSICLIEILLAASCQNINIDSGDDDLLAPSSFKATANGTDVDLEWANSTGAISYTVYYKKDPATVGIANGYYDVKKDSILTNTTTVSLLDAGYAYAFIVVAVGTGGIASNPSTIATATVTGAMAAPTFSRAAGIYIGNQNVVIEHSGVPYEDKIVYTTDGTKPTRTNGTVLTSDYVTVTTSATLKAIEYRPSWNSSTDSPVTSAEYTIADLYTLNVSESADQVFDPMGTFMSTSRISAVNIANAEFTAMKVVGTHVYVAGSANVLKVDGTTWVRAACFWNNDEITIRLDITDGESRANAIDVDASGNVYVAGSTGAIGSEIATTWKWAFSGGSITPTLLDHTTAGTNSSANAIFVYGSTPTVYAAGFDYQLNGIGPANPPHKVACYWVGSARTVIGSHTGTDTGTIGSIATAVAYDGNRVMVAGYVEGIAFFSAKYWQYVSSVVEYDPAGNGTYSQVLSGGYAGGNFIMTGYEQASGDKARAWKLAPATPSSIQEIDLHPTPATSSRASSFGLDSIGNIWYGGYAFGGLPTGGNEQQGCVWVNSTRLDYFGLESFTDMLGVYARIK